MLPMAGLIAMHLLITRQISLRAGLVTGAAAGAVSLALTVLVDSWFWQRWLWPEGEVLWFNTAQNRCGLKLSGVQRGAAKQSFRVLRLFHIVNTCSAHAVIYAA